MATANERPISAAVEPRLLKKVALKNGLVLEFWDQSRKLAGDRWLVAVIARVPITLSRELFAGLADGEKIYADLAARHGDAVCFQQEHLRHFIDEREVEKLRQAIMARLERTLPAYVGGGDFARRFARKLFKDLQEELRLEQLRKEAAPSE